MMNRVHEFTVKIEFDKRYSKKEARSIARDVLHHKKCSGYLKSERIELRVVTIRGIK